MLLLLCVLWRSVMYVAHSFSPNSSCLFSSFVFSRAQLRRYLPVGVHEDVYAEPVQLLRDMRPLPLRKWDKAFRSTPSVQGAWEMGHELTRPHRVLRSRAVGIEPGAGTLRLGDSPKKWSLKR